MAMETSKYVQIYQLHKAFTVFWRLSPPRGSPPLWPALNWTPICLARWELGSPLGGSPQKGSGYPLINGLVLLGKSGSRKHPETVGDVPLKHGLQPVNLPTNPLI